MTSYGATRKYEGAPGETASISSSFGPVLSHCIYTNSGRLQDGTGGAGPSAYVALAQTPGSSTKVGDWSGLSLKRDCRSTATQNPTRSTPLPLPLSDLPRVRKSVSDICTLNEMEISNAEDIVQALKPMLVATNVMCEERTPTVSIIAPLHTQLLSDMSSTAKDSPLINELKTAIYQDLSKRFNSSEEKSNLYISSALDPGFKSLLFLSPEDMHETFTKVVSKAAALKESADLMDNRFQSTPPPDQERSTMYAAADGMIDYSDPGKDLSTAHCPKRRKSALADLLGQMFNSSSTNSI
ncbi:Zinc finger BED domain-containing protein 1 [Anabarilius grahami]|uniref:Zinc finger BED domain-containing protein 1 n=1 Tax=Anabarilius grahami TaxID=495550 RepID=A0A3N0Y180_ANAGA|nr:Zinc finger BED domain-containing protein 1 [Anabarilius grahami]